MGPNENSSVEMNEGPWSTGWALTTTFLARSRLSSPSLPKDGRTVWKWVDDFPFLPVG